MTESEMVERYVDGLKRASDRASSFVSAEAKDKPKLFVEFIDGIKVAAGSAHQLAHAQENPKWLDTRDILEGIIAVGQSLPVFSENDGRLWSRVKDNLDTLVVTGQKLATARAMKRVDVLTNLDFRAKNAHLLGDNQTQIQ